MFGLAFNTGNAAFEDGAATETARILRLVAEKIEGGQLNGTVLDLNGNQIGSFNLDGSD